jgi:3-(3-hydroxy-phenyl)propionate hydroxylase
METNQQPMPEQAQAAAGQASAELPAAVDVLLVGLGPVGAVIANLLGRYGVKTLVIDKATEIFTAPRAIALDNEALRILQMAGLEEGDFDTIAIPYVRMKSPYMGEFGRINTLGSIDGHPKLVTFYQPELESALRARLAAHHSVRTALGVSLTGFTQNSQSVIVNLEFADGRSFTIAATYLVAADGASSLMRGLIGQEFEGKTFAEDWLIVDAHKVASPIDHVEFICDNRRPVAHMTAPGDRERWEFMLHPGESRQEMESDARIRELLAPWARPEQLILERKAVYRFHARAANAFSKGRVFLAGDAAHITPPFVGQGLVAGMRDAANLSWKLAWVIHGRADPQILDSYDQERRPHAKAMINLAKFMGRLVMPRSASVAMLTHGLMRLARLTQLRALFDELGMKPKNLFRRGLFVKGCSGAKLVRGGLLAQGWVRGPDGGASLSDDVLGPALTLIGFGRDAGSALDEGTYRAFAAAGGTIVQIAHRGQQLHLVRERCWEDLEGVFLPGSAPFGWAAVVRPDRTILHDGPVTEANRLVSESLALLGTAPGSATHSADAAVPPLRGLFPMNLTTPGLVPMKLTTPQPARHPSPTAKATALAYLMFDRPDLARAEQFLTDFGLRTVAKEGDLLFLRGTGPAPFCYVVRKAHKARFVGFGLRVNSLAELEALSRLPGASAVEALSWPGGGRRVRLTDPSGFQVDAVLGQSDVEALPHRPPLPFNSADATVLRVNETQRPPAAPAEIIRLGHVVLELADYQATCAWYTQHFGFIPSDVQVLPDGSPAVAFMRLDLGSAPADHHTLALAQGFAPMYSHSAYEVVDADAVGMGQRVLRQKGWKHAWGIGRHLLGSQLFDYWQDPWGDKHEHYCDGDLFTADQPAGIYAISRQAMSQWGKVMPPSFTRPKITLANVAALVSNLRRSPDLSVAKLRTLMKLFG